MDFQTRDAMLADNNMVQSAVDGVSRHNKAAAFPSDMAAGNLIRETGEEIVAAINDGIALGNHYLRECG